MPSYSYDDPFNEYPPHSHLPNPDYAETCQVCGALIMVDMDEDGFRDV